MSTNKLQLVYMPYISMPLQEDIQIGRVRIWNYSSKANEYIKDDSLRQYINRILELNKDNKKPIANIGIVSIGDIDFRTLNEEELQEIKDARIILFLSFLSSQLHLPDENRGNFMRTAENFQCVLQNLSPSDRFIAKIAGTLVRIHDMNLITNLTMSKPACVTLNQPHFKMDTGLIESLSKLKSKRKQLYRRIIRASEIFIQSYYNNEDINFNLRMVSQMTAFETLLELGKYPREEFKNKIEKYTVTPEDKRYIHFYDPGKQDCKRTMKGKWADNFYRLRNKIVHGDLIKEGQVKFRKKELHFYIATMFFIVLIKKIVDENRIRKYFDVAIIWNSKEQVFKLFNLLATRKDMRDLIIEIRKAKLEARKRH